MHKQTLSAGLGLALLLLSNAASAQDSIPLENLVKQAATLSTLARPGAAPFHLKATIADERTHNPKWNAEVEEWWEVPTMWRRQFHSECFCQSLRVNGNDFFSDNPGLQWAAEEQLTKWRFRPSRNQGAPVQVISTLTFAFSLPKADSALNAVGYPGTAMKLQARGVPFVESSVAALSPARLRADSLAKLAFIDMGL